MLQFLSVTTSVSDHGSVILVTLCVFYMVVSYLFLVAHTCVQSGDRQPALLPEFSPSRLPLHTCTAPPSLAFPSLWCFVPHQLLPWRYSIYFPLLRFFRLASTCTSSPHQGLFVFKPALFPQSLLVRQFSSHLSSRNSCYPVSFPPVLICLLCSPWIYGLLSVLVLLLSGFPSFASFLLPDCLLIFFWILHYLDWRLAFFKARFWVCLLLCLHLDPVLAHVTVAARTLVSVGLQWLKLPPAVMQRCRDVLLSSSNTRYKHLTFVEQCVLTWC